MMNVSYHIRKAIIELEMAKFYAENAAERHEVQDIMNSILKLKWATKVKK